MDSNGSARIVLLRCLLGALVLGVATSNAACSSEPRQAILIAVDTLRADHLSLYGYERPTTPRIDAWARRGAVFDEARAASPWTVPSMASLLTGELPSQHEAGERAGDPGWTFPPPLDSAQKVLPEVLHTVGFKTAAVINNSFLHPAVGLNRGFDRYDYQPPTRSRERRADAVVDASLAWVDAHRDDSFFLLVHIMDPHMPYDAPAPFRGRFTEGLPGGFRLPVVEPRKIRERVDSIGEEERAFIRAAYDEEIAFVDAQIGRFLDALAEGGRWDRRVVVFTADHGEELFDHGGFDHGHSVHRELLHVPLIVWGPDVPPGRYHDAVSLVDVVPTLLDGLGVPAWEGMAGASLWPALRRGVEPPPQLVIAEGTLYGPERRAVISWPFKLTVEVGANRRRLYDLKTDPGERRDIAAERRHIVELLSHDLDGMRAARWRAKSNEVEIDAETIESLRVLGYVE